MPHIAETGFGTQDNAATRCVHELSGCQSRSLLFGQGLGLTFPRLNCLHWTAYGPPKVPPKPVALQVVLPRVNPKNQENVVLGLLLVLASSWKRQFWIWFGRGEWGRTTMHWFSCIIFCRQRLWFTCPRAWAYAAVLGMCNSRAGHGGVPAWICFGFLWPIDQLWRVVISFCLTIEGRFNAHTCSYINDGRLITSPNVQMDDHPRCKLTGSSALLGAFLAGFCFCTVPCCFGDWKSATFLDILNGLNELRMSTSTTPGSVRWKGWQPFWCDTFLRVASASPCRWKILEIWKFGSVHLSCCCAWVALRWYERQHQCARLVNAGAGAYLERFAWDSLLCLWRSTSSWSWALLGEAGGSSPSF